MVFPVVMYGCESWTVKKAEHWRIDAFELWCWRRLLRVPWTARRSNESILKEISPGCSLEGMMLKVVLWPPHAKSWLIGKDCNAGRDWGQEEKGTEDEMPGWNYRLYGRESEWTLGVGDGQGGLACCNSWGPKELDTTERLNWTELNGLVVFPTFFNLSLNFAVRTSWSEPVSSQSCFCWLYRASPSLATKNIINLIKPVIYICWVDEQMKEWEIYLVSSQNSILDGSVSCRIILLLSP